jgi:hypothetical protein
VAERCASVSLPKLAVPGLGGITVGASAPTITVPLKACCQIANFSWTLGSISIPIAFPGPVADALSVLEQLVDDYNAATEFGLTCPSN